MKKLPDAEYAIMQIVWDNPPPITSTTVLQHLSRDICWKPQTILTLMNRLENRGFLSSEKLGKERFYSPLIDQNTYLKYETDNFIKKFHKDSFLSLVNTLYSGKKLDDNDLKELTDWINERK